MTTADELLLKRLKPKTVRAMAGQIEYAVGIGGLDRNCEAAQAPDVLLQNYWLGGMDAAESILAKLRKLLGDTK